MYTNAHFWRDMAILAGAWGMAIWGLLNMKDDGPHRSGGASGHW